MRLINADKLESDMYHNAFEADTELQKWDSGCWIRYKMFENALELAQKVDAEPVRHGRWLWCDGVRCSICNHKLQTTGLTSYCPNCGAKMDEAEDDKLSKLFKKREKEQWEIDNEANAEC